MLRNVIDYEDINDQIEFINDDIVELKETQLIFYHKLIDYIDVLFCLQFLFMFIIVLSFNYMYHKYKKLKYKLKYSSVV